MKTNCITKDFITVSHNHLRSGFAAPDYFSVENRSRKIVKEVVKMICFLTYL